MAIDINIPSQVAQTITNGVTGTAPSQDAVFDALALKENTANKGVANGYAPLNSSTKIDSSYLPSYVDDVIEVANYAALPVTGESGKIYITLNNNLLFRWGGTVYVQVGGQDPVWGGIVGTLSNQTDLQNVLNGKYDDPTGTTAQYIRGDGTLATFPTLTGYVPYTGANTDLDLGTYNLTADHISLNTSPSGAGFVVGSTQWNNALGSSETLLKGGNVTLKNGVDLVARIVNNTGIQLTKAAYQVVKVSGAQGQRLAVNLAQANTDLNSADTLGIVTETIANNQEGFILTVGQIEEINTTGSLQGETWADGDVLYLSPSTAGKVTNIKPTGLTGHIVVLGYVEYSHAIHGKIYVKIMNGWELDELHNVYINPGTKANNDSLIYDSASQLWKNQALKTINSNSIIGSGNIVTTYIRRHETTSSYDYLGYALSGTAESSTGWTITRLTITSAGTTTVEHATGAWSNRTSLTYI
jgi:nitrogen fixation protein